MKGLSFLYFVYWRSVKYFIESFTKRWNYFFSLHFDDERWQLFSASLSLLFSTLRGNCFVESEICVFLCELIFRRGFDRNSCHCARSVEEKCLRIFILMRFHIILIIFIFFWFFFLIHFLMSLWLYESYQATCGHFLL